MPGFSDLVRLLLPGIVCDRDHWRERALNAEARLSDLIGQIDATCLREREEWRNEREQLLGRLRGENSLPLPPEDDGWRGDGTRSIASRRSNPIARAYAAHREAQNAIPDEVVEEAVDEYLKLRAET